MVMIELGGGDSRSRMNWAITTLMMSMQLTGVSIRAIVKY